MRVVNVQLGGGADIDGKALGKARGRFAGHCDEFIEIGVVADRTRLLKWLREIANKVHSGGFCLTLPPAPPALTPPLPLPPSLPLPSPRPSFSRAMADGT